MKKTEAINTFNEGLIMDINPLLASNKGLCNALNATIITMNGNENVLQNDMGNGRVETARLPEGYVPIGTTSFGGIIYIVSYNPSLNRCQIGSFPSPERNITAQEINDNLNLDLGISSNNFLEESYDLDKNIPEYIIKNNIIKTKLSEYTLHPGDKFIVAGNGLASASDYITEKEELPKYIKLKLATIDNNGRIIYLNNLIKYKVNGHQFEIGDVVMNDINSLDEYQKQVDSAYNIFTSKIAGQLYVISSLETIDNIQVGWKILNRVNNKFTIKFDILTTSLNNLNISGIKLIYDNSYEYYERSKNETNKLSFEKEIDFSNSELSEKYFKIIPFMDFGLIESLSTDISIDFTSIGKGLPLITSSWKYKTDLDTLTINYTLNSNLNIDESIIQKNLYFIPYEKLLTKDLQIEDIIKSCNNIQLVSNNVDASQNILLGNNENSSPLTLIKDTLYICLFQIKTNINTYNLYKCLYTNGVFNNYYKPGSIDFDKIQIPIDYKIIGQINKEYIKQSEQSLKDFSEYSRKDIGIVKNCSQTRISGLSNLNLNLSLQNSYNNCFTVDSNNDIKYDNIKVLHTYLDSQYNIQNTGNINVDSGYVKPIQQINSNKEINTHIIKHDWNEGDWVNVSIDSHQKFTIEGEFYDRIASDFISRAVTSLNYYSPIIKNFSDLEKYGIVLTGNILDFKTKSFYGLGLTNTNYKNNRYEGRDRMVSTLNLQYDLNSQEYYFKDINLITDAKTFGNGHEFFSDNFPELTKNDESYEKLDQIIPLMMTPCGQGHAKLISMYNKQIPYNIYDQALTAKKGFEKYPYNGKYRIIQLLIKPYYDPSQPEQYRRLHMLGGFFRVTGQHYDIKFRDAYNKIVNSTLPNLIGSFLFGSFYNDTSSHTPVNIFTYNNISCYNNTKHNIKCECECEIKSNLNIQFKNTNLKSIQDQIEFLTEQAFPCLSINLNNTNIRFEIQLNFETNNPLKDKFYNASNISTINSYIDFGPFLQIDDLDSDISIDQNVDGSYPSVAFLSKSEVGYNLGSNSHLFNIINGKLYLNKSVKILINFEDYEYKADRLYIKQLYNPIKDYDLLYIHPELSGEGEKFERSCANFGGQLTYIN